MPNEMTASEALAYLRYHWRESFHGKFMFAGTREAVEAIAPLVENRWAAFTDDELNAISDDWLVGESHEHLEAHLERLASESKAELERRRGATS